VIRGGAIGDFILTLPAIAALRKQFPGVHLEILGYPHIIQLAVEAGLADRAQPIEARGLAGFFARGGELEPDLVDYFSEFDLIVSYLYDPDAIFQFNVARCTTAQFIAGPHRPDERLGVHATSVFLKPLERLAIFEADNVPRLSLGPKPFDTQDSTSKAMIEPRQIALHPGSGSERKNWPENRWAELVQRLINSTRSNLLMIGAEAEAERLQRLAAALPPARVRVAQSLPLTDLTRLLNRCSAFVGHDSGISHLAAAIGLPGVLLWADTPEEIWRPPSQKMRILRDPGGISHVPVEPVFERLLALDVELGQKTC
jgi:heptosyltransferase-2